MMFLVDLCTDQTNCSESSVKGSEDVMKLLANFSKYFITLEVRLKKLVI